MWCICIVMNPPLSIYANRIRALSWQILVREVSFVCHMFRITTYIALKLCMFAGSRRGIGVNQERDQTLNQLLTVLLLLLFLLFSFSSS